MRQTSPGGLLLLEAAPFGESVAHARDLLLKRSIDTPKVDCWLRLLLAENEPSGPSALCSGHQARLDRSARPATPNWSAVAAAALRFAVEVVVKDR